MMDHLLRKLAPISEVGWKILEDEAKSRFTTYLAARKLVDFEDPKGWSHSATDLGRVGPITGPSAGVTALQRQVLPLVELRAEISVSRAELADAERGATNLDLAELDEAIKNMAVAENAVVFHGYPASGIQGITGSTTQESIALDPDIERYPNVVARAVDLMRQSGIGGPYGMAIGPAGYTRIIETTEHGGFLLLDHLRQILEGPVVWAPGVEGAVVLSLRGGDFVLECGQDLSIGYRDHDAETVNLYLEETLSFHVADTDAAVVLNE